MTERYGAGKLARLQEMLQALEDCLSVSERDVEGNAS
jgi:hypothetical protein